MITTVAEAAAHFEGYNKGKKAASLHWIPVKQKTPYIGEEVLTCANDRIYHCMYLYSSLEKRYIWKDKNNGFLQYSKNYMDYWMRIPAIPKKEDDIFVENS